MKKSTFVRRLLALATAAVMLLSAVPAMAAFRDTAGHWAEKTLTEWQEQGLIDGYSDGGVHPNASVTRAEFVKLLNRALNFTAESAISFTDVKESDWFYAEAAKAAAAGYAQGSNGAFHPGQAITRAEAAAMIARAVSLTADEDLTSLDLQRFYKHLLDGGRVDRIEAKKKLKGLAPKTVRNIHQMIGSAYNLAMPRTARRITKGRFSTVENRPFETPRERKGL